KRKAPVQPDTGALFLSTSTDLCMVAGFNTYTLMVKYEYLTGAQIGSGPYYMIYSVWVDYTHVELVEPMQLKEV
ncbi:hypothetical protein LCGC14_1864910, partial [marine sediment metagenome]